MTSKLYYNGNKQFKLDPSIKHGKISNREQLMEAHVLLTFGDGFPNKTACQLADAAAITELGLEGELLRLDKAIWQQQFVLPRNGSGAGFVPFGGNLGAIEAYVGRYGLQEANPIAGWRKAIGQAANLPSMYAPRVGPKPKVDKYAPAEVTFSYGLQSYELARRLLKPKIFIFMRSASHFHPFDLFHVQQN